MIVSLSQGHICARSSSRWGCRALQIWYSARWIGMPSDGDEKHFPSSFHNEQKSLKKYDQNQLREDRNVLVSRDLGGVFLFDTLWWNSEWSRDSAVRGSRGTKSCA